MPECRAPRLFSEMELDSSAPRPRRRPGHRIRKRCRQRPREIVVIGQVLAPDDEAKPLNPRRFERELAVEQGIFLLPDVPADIEGEARIVAAVDVGPETAPAEIVMIVDRGGGRELGRVLELVATDIGSDFVIAAG